MASRVDLMPHSRDAILFRMVAPAIRLFPEDSRIGLVGVRFPVELRTDGVDASDPATWPAIDGRLEYVGGRLLYMPPCADFQQDVAADVTFVLRTWSEQQSTFIVGGNEAGMRLGADIRAADIAVWRASEAGARTGRLRSTPPVLAVEISGEDEEERVLRDKARWYREHGVAIVWLVFPESREVIVIDASGEARFASGHLPPDDTLPGLTPAISSFFAQLDR